MGCVLCSNNMFDPRILLGVLSVMILFDGIEHKLESMRCCLEEITVGQFAEWRWVGCRWFWIVGHWTGATQIRCVIVIANNWIHFWVVNGRKCWVDHKAGSKELQNEIEFLENEITNRIGIIEWCARCVRAYLEYSPKFVRTFCDDEIIIAFQWIAFDVSAFGHFCLIRCD